MVQALPGRTKSLNMVMRMQSLLSHMATKKFRTSTLIFNSHTLTNFAFHNFEFLTSTYLDKREVLLINYPKM